MTNERKIPPPLRPPVTLARTGLLILLIPFWLAGCASLSSVHKIHLALHTTNARVAQAEAQNRALADQIRSLQAEIASAAKSARAREATLAAATQRATQEARIALDQARQANASLVASLTQASHRTGAGRGSHYRWLFARILAQAHALALRPYAPLPLTPLALRRISHPLFRSLSYRGTLPFWPTHARVSLHFKPAGYLFDRPVKIYLVARGKIVPLNFTPEDFGLPPPLIHQLPPHIAASGFEIMNHIPGQDRTRAVLSFLGAGYFRARGRDQAWGPLARGIAINTAITNHPERFPAFRSFWIVAPNRHDPSLTLFALLDGSSVTGVYRFRVTSGGTASMHVAAVLFLRHRVRRLGLAPLVSMFLRGRMDVTQSVKLHPAIHDSDGLSYETRTGRWVWSPLANPKHLNVRLMNLANPRGFGLMQRDRHPKAYQSMPGHDQASPNVWVQPDGDWGPGQLELVEIPTERATNSNIMTFWVPSSQPPPGTPLMLRYTIRWGAMRTPVTPLGRVVATREMQAAHGGRTFALYFQGERLRAIPSWINLEPVIETSGHGKARDISLVKLPGTGRWRLRFTVSSHPGLILKTWIHYRAKPLTETWTYQIPR